MTAASPGTGAGLGPGAFNDLDLHLFDAPSVAGSTLASSTGLQGCSLGMVPSGDPLEIIVHFQHRSDAARHLPRHRALLRRPGRSSAGGDLRPRAVRAG